MKRIQKLFAFFWNRSLLIFLVIGGVNTLLSMTVNGLLNHYAGWHFFFSSAFAFVVTSVPSFYFNRKYSFKSKAPLRRSLLKFTVLVTGCFLLSYGLNELLLPRLQAGVWSGMNGLLYTLVRIVGLQVVFTVLNYLGQRLWAFKNPPGSAAE
jgi:putative flippase GtrA